MPFPAVVLEPSRSPPTPAMRQQLTIRFDGGCVPNPGSKYGSYEVRVWNKVVIRCTRFALGFGTNNEAEFEALEKALSDTLKDLRCGGFDPKHFDVTVITDSIIVQGRLKDNWRPKKIKSESHRRSIAMAILADRCLLDLDQFGSFKTKWERRDSNVAAFGH